jgi:hypothetical protein
MSPSSSPEAVFGLTGLRSNIDGIEVTTERLGHLRLPEKFTPEHMERIRNDLAILAETAKEKPEEMAAFQNAVLAQDPTVPQRADELGLTEEKMAARGGGALWVVVAVIAIGAALLLSSDSPPPPEPAPS